MSAQQEKIKEQLATWERALLVHKIAEQERIIDDQCDTIIDLVNTLDARDLQ